MAAVDGWHTKERSRKKLAAFAMMQLCSSILVTTLVLAWSQSSSGLDAVEWRENLACPIGSVSRPTPTRAPGPRGVLANEGGGGWPSGTEPLIELVGAGRASNRHVLTAAVPSGEISFAKVPAGDYWFRAGERQGGWGCHWGVVAVTGGKSRDVLRIEIPLGRCRGLQTHSADGARVILSVNITRRGCAATLGRR